MNGFWKGVLHTLTALGTVGAVVVALWGDYFKSKLFPPKLELKVLNATRGQRTKETLRVRALPEFAGQPVTREEDAVYFYLFQIPSAGMPQARSRSICFRLRSPGQTAN